MESGLRWVARVFMAKGYASGSGRRIWFRILFSVSVCGASEDEACWLSAGGILLCCARKNGRSRNDAVRGAEVWATECRRGDVLTKQDSKEHESTQQIA